jgi:hypothetical protein
MSAAKTTPSDADVARAFRDYVEHWTRGPLEDLRSLYDEIAASEQTGFPWEPALESLSRLEPRRLWRAFDDDELQDLYDWASEADLSRTAKRFAAACEARPYVDDGKVPPQIRQLVMKRDGERCKHCGADSDLTIDHKIVPWVDGGSSKDPANLQVLCRGCNSRKGRKPESG